jgi:hypothetical protein
MERIRDEPMTVINIQSVKDAVHTGTLIELSSDYRTAASVRTLLPKNTPCAISSAAFRKHIHGPTAGDKRSGMETLCVFLSRAFGLGGIPPTADSRFQLPGDGVKLLSQPLKLEWYAPDKRWVILLPDEQLQPAMKLA